MDAKKKELGEVAEAAAKAFLAENAMDDVRMVEFMAGAVWHAALAQPAQGEVVAYLWEDTSFHKGERPRGVFMGKPTVQTLTNKNIRLTNLYEAIATGEAVEALKAIADGEGEAQEIARQTLSSLELAAPQPPADTIAVPRSELDVNYVSSAAFNKLYGEAMAMLDAVKLAHEALRNSKPTHAHYQEPVERHENALKACAAIIDAAKSTGEDV